MDPHALANALALLAVIAGGGAAVVVVRRVTGRSTLDGPSALVAGFGIATVATAGSLVYSEVFHFTPCALCWWQRAAMYPLVPILGVAAWRGSLATRRLAVPVALIGAAISTWHVLVQRVPALASSASCDAAAPCSGIWVEGLGVFTIPTMALAGFLGIAAVLTTARPMT